MFDWYLNKKGINMKHVLNFRIFYVKTVHDRNKNVGHYKLTHPLIAAYGSTELRALNKGDSSFGHD